MSDHHDLAGQLTGRTVVLRPVSTPDVGWLYELATTDSRALAWRLHGSTPSPEAFQWMLWDNVLAQFVVFDVRSGERAGLVSLYNPNFTAGYVYLGVMIGERFRSGPRTLEALVLLVNRAFQAWPFRKIYLEAPRYSLEMASSALDLPGLEVEVTLEDSDYSGGTYHDTLICSFSRSAWDDLQDVVAPWIPT